MKGRYAHPIVCSRREKSVTVLKAWFENGRSHMRIAECTQFRPDLILHLIMNNLKKKTKESTLMQGCSYKRTNGLFEKELR